MNIGRGKAMFLMTLWIIRGKVIPTPWWVSLGNTFRSFLLRPFPTGTDTVHARSQLTITVQIPALSNPDTPVFAFTRPR
ncbi:hypothetical protein J3A83DRAFT_4273564 [Scleroderma citrinum]